MTLSLVGETFAEARHRNSHALALRQALSRGKWVSGPRLAILCGHRFGAALERIRKGLDGGPMWDIITERLNDSGSQWRYRWTGKVLSRPQLIRRPRKDLQAELKRLRAQVKAAHYALSAAGLEIPEMP